MNATETGSIDRRIHLRMRTFFAIVGALVLAGCDSAVISGTVIDARGQALPGVAVRVDDTPYETLTNGRGEYRLRYIPQESVRLRFAKTGFTSFTLEQPAEYATKIEAPKVRLAQLPESPGVFLYENYEYIRTTFETAQTLKLKSDQTIVMGTVRKDLVETLKRAPAIGIYRGYQIPAYGIRLNKLVSTEVMPPEGLSGEEGIVAWTRGPEVPIDVRPVDGSNREQAQLLQIFFQQELDYGAYAVHWGALDGVTTTNEPRIFCFKVVEELTPSETEQSVEATPGTPSASGAPDQPENTPAEDDEG